MPNVTATPFPAFTPGRMKSETYEWFIQLYPWDVTATLTTKNNTNEWWANSDIKHFWNVIDRKIYGKASKSGERIKRLCLLDRGANNTNIHYHIVVLTPTDAGWTREDFCKLMSSTWISLKCAGDHNTIGPIQSVGGCVGYLSKKCRSDLDPLDLSCSHF